MLLASHSLHLDFGHAIMAQQPLTAKQIRTTQKGNWYWFTVSGSHAQQVTKTTEYKTLHYGRRRRRHAGWVLVLSVGCDMGARASGVATNIPLQVHSATWRLKLANRPSRHPPANITYNIHQPPPTIKREKNLAGRFLVSERAAG